MIDPPARGLDDLAVFVVVAELASFIAAARRLAMPTSSVSRAVARLEEQLGVALLRRTSRKVTVTDEGRQLLLGAAPHVEGLSEALALAADRRATPTGALRVTAPAYTGATRVARALAAFAAAHPGITIELDTSNTLHDLVRDGFDFAVRVGNGLSPDLIARRLWQGQLGLFAARELVRRELRGRRVVSREQLERAPCVVMRATSVWRFDGPDGKTIEIAPQPRFAVNDPRAIIEVASRGLGIAMTPVDAAAHARTLVPLRADFGEPQPIDLFVVYPTRRLLPQRVRMAIEWLATRG
ncbi:MAG: LysR family transcriptional regulator [Deltaproteobacteria bacterium]|nr:LysR family transcriptional regulator [Deltaproteobacteria bacterium]